MLTTRTHLLAGCLAGSMLLTACGGSSSGSSSGATDDPGDTGGTAVDVTGNVTAPAGAVATLVKHNSLLIVVRDALFSRAHAAITGLMPVEGATVELIRVDDQGVQTGDVLATATTSITGDYTLTVPAGVDLAGNLIVRVSGSGGTEMRAQVVEQEVDINPVSEFVLQKFIDQGADLDNLETTSVIKLTGQIEEFDLTAGADLSEMLDSLEQETGDFVEDQISVIASTPGDAATLAGSYRAIELGFGLHDDDQQYGVGTLSVDGGILEFDLSDQGMGDVTLEFNLEESFYSNQFFNNDTVSLSYNVEIETGDIETDTGRIDDKGVLSVEAEFSEDIDGDFGWREPPSVSKLQKVGSNNIFVGTFADASVRYQTIDTNNDDIKDAIDPDAREGDEVFKTLLIAAEKPTAMTTSDLTGDFGRIYFEALLGANGFYNVRVERNILSFDGVGLFDIGETQIADLERTPSSFAYVESMDQSDTGISYSVSENGTVVTADGEDENSLFSDTFDFFVVHTPSIVDDANPDDNLIAELEAGITLAVKLPAAQLDISSKVYRVFFMGVALTQTSTALATGRFSNTLTVNSDGVSGSLFHELIDIEKATSTAEVVAFDDEPVTQETTISLAANGEATIVVNDPEGAFTFNGYFSHDGGMGIFSTRYADTGEDPDELGVVMLVEIDATE